MAGICSSLCGHLSPLVHDGDADLWAIGPESLGDRALVTAEAPELRLPDLDGNAIVDMVAPGPRVTTPSPCGGPAGQGPSASNTVAEWTW